MISRDILAILLVLLICLPTASADAHPDNFMLSVDKDLKLFGIGRR